jgi:TRAP-type mannitol/chloroaromatic compound transport system substrate-binding protein
VDGAQQVRGADDARVSNVQGVQGLGSRVSNGSGGIAGTVLQHGGAAEEVMASGMVETSLRAAEDRPVNWNEMSKGQKRLWFRNAKKRDERKVQQEGGK